MDIAIFGSSLVSAYWNGAATYYRGMVSALSRLGHRITFYEPDAYDRQKNRDMADPPWARVVVYPGDDDDAALAMLEQARGADLIVKTSGIGVYDALLEAALPAARRPGQLIAFWDVDAPVTLERLDADPHDPFRALVPQYDLVFTYGGGPPVVAGYTAQGAALCAPIYNAVDPQTHHPVAPDPRYAGDLGFLGNRLPDREERVDAFFLAAAQRMPRQRCILAGSGWDGKSLPPNVRAIGHLTTNDHNAFNCTLKAVLNISRDSMARYGHSPATRVFEAAGAAACLITDAWPGLEAFLEPGTEILVAHDGAQVAEIVEGLTPQHASRVGASARRRVLAEHTYTHRAAEMAAILTGHAPTIGRTNTDQPTAALSK